MERRIVILMAKRSKEEIERFKQICKENGIIYDTFVHRLKLGYTEEEAAHGVKKTCKYCGREFTTFKRREVYCCEECKYQSFLRQKREHRKRNNKVDYTKDIENEDGNLIEIYHRPLTQDTKYLVNLWYSRGDSVEEIAYILRRPQKVIRDLLVTDN